MPNNTYTKAQRILSDPTRVHASRVAEPPEFWVGIIEGDHGNYTTIAVSPEFAREHGRDNQRLACTCPCGRVAKHTCSHMLVAEEMRLRGSV